MHPDGTEHRWLTSYIIEQGQALPMETWCGDCGLDTADLWQDGCRWMAVSTPFIDPDELWDSDEVLEQDDDTLEEDCWGDYPVYEPYTPPDWDWGTPLIDGTTRIGPWTVTATNLGMCE